MASGKKQKINESPSVTSNNYLNVGDSGTNLKPAKVSLVDVFNQHAKMQADAQSSPGILPYPLNSTVIDELGEVVVGVSDVEKKVRGAGSVNFIKDNPKAAKAVKEILEALSDAKKKIGHAAQQLDNLT